MTTLVRTRMPLETLRMSQQPGGKRRSKRIAAYDEEDGDFVFTRGSKRTKAVEAPVESEAAPSSPATAKRGRKSKDRSDEGDLAEKQPRGRRTSPSIPKPDTEIIISRKRKIARSSVGKAPNGRTGANTSAMDTTNYDSVDMVGSTTLNRTPTSGAEESAQSRMITLPFGDTPKIARNKEMRKKGTENRRSSLGLRGRRASSLIDNGHSAIPHRAVEVSEFYKHIEADGLSEPRRMKQLLTWTGERELGDKPSHGEANDLSEQAARTIKDALLKDFANKSEYSNWFTREESAPRKIIKKPNPRNTELEENIAESDARIKILRQERDQWKALAKRPPSLPPIFQKGTIEITPSQIDASLLSPEQSSILATISSAPALDLRKQISKQTEGLLSGLEFQVDKFADGIHKLEQYQQTTGRAANKILSLGAARLEERDRREKEAVGTRDLPMQEVLRSLSRILPESSSSER